MNQSDDLTDREWDAVRALLPRCGPSGSDYRTIVNGILWQQRGGRRWHDLPTHYGPWHRCAERLRLWNTDGTWQRVLALLVTHRPLGDSRPLPRDSGHPENAGDPSADDWNTPWLA
ncbi:transposase [Streptomyces sp. A1136]|uniref:transposase n=1 Tax=Streptomyces sp. A1136 TaxID=2563102 RepID=UPI00109EBC7D|nr:transposase [Streptomyces sp. A1136]THA44495.1 transposase [Streptomyces sp. A1136]